MRDLTRMDLQLFAEGDGSGAGSGGAGGGSNAGGGGTGQGNPAGGTGAGSPGQGSGDGGAGGGAKTYSQEELDRIIGERLGRERQKYGDYEDLKKRAGEYDKLKASQMSDLEKAQAKAADEEKKRITAEREAAEARLEAKKLLILEELGLAKSFANRVFGTTEEEIRNDAKALQKLLGEKGKAVGSASNPGGGGGQDEVARARQVAEARNKGPARPEGAFDPWARK